MMGFGGKILRYRFAHISHFPDTRDEGWEESRSEGERPQNFRIFSKKIFPKEETPQKYETTEKYVINV